MKNKIEYEFVKVNCKNVDKCGKRQMIIKVPKGMKPENYPNIYCLQCFDNKNGNHERYR